MKNFFVKFWQILAQISKKIGNLKIRSRTFPKKAKPIPQCGSHWPRRLPFGQKMPFCTKFRSVKRLFWYLQNYEFEPHPTLHLTTHVCTPPWKFDLHFQLIERTKALSFRSQMLQLNVEKKKKAQDQPNWGDNDTF